MESCRQFKELFVEVRERASKAIGFAKMLRKVYNNTRSFHPVSGRDGLCIGISVPFKDVVVRINRLHLSH